MSPHQFAHSTTGGSDHDLMATPAGDDGSKVVKRGGSDPVGLSKEQLQQALLYLIKVGNCVVTVC